MTPLRLLVAESEPKADRDARRASVGRSSGETYVERLRELSPGSHIDRCKPADAEREIPGVDALCGYDAVFLTGSPLHLYEETPETLREVSFMRAVFAAGVPSFGSCAGLQVAVVAAGGTVRAQTKPREVGFARRITPTAVGASHPLLAGRPPSFDAPAIHSDEVATLPEGATLLASNARTAVQALEIRHAAGVFWGVQYHPELSLYEVAAALRRQSKMLIEDGLAASAFDVAGYAEQVEWLHNSPERADVAWRLGLDRQVTDASARMVEISNFLAWVRRAW